MDITDKSVHTWNFLAEKFAAEQEGVIVGKMMSAPALKYAGKVFVFHSTMGGSVGLGCRLGRDFDVAKLGLNDWQYLAPFKTKPPMKDWIITGIADVDRWEELAQTALDLARKNS